MAVPQRTIFIFSLEPWGDMWYSKQHYAAQLAKVNGVYFITLPDRWRWQDVFSFGTRIRATPEGVNVVEYRNNLPLRILPRFVEHWINRINAWKLSRLPRAYPPLFWCFHPTPLLDFKVLRTKDARVIYHVVDPYQIFPNDPEFARKADVVAGINPWYVKHYEPLNPKTLLIPHGVRDKDRSFLPERVESHRARWGRYVVMAAGINYRTNYYLLLHVAAHFPQLTFVLVGPLVPVKADLSALRNRLLDMPNVVHTGVMHPDELRHIIRGAEIGLVTYDFEPTRSVPDSAAGTPLKVITYLAQHCPVVSTINSYVPALDQHGTFKAENEQHFLQLMQMVLNKELKVDTERVDAYLDEHSYEQLTTTICKDLPASAQADTKGLPAPSSKVPRSSPVLIISNEAWNGPRYSKHRYALALRSSHRVLFLDPARAWRPTHPFRWRLSVRDTPEGISVISYFNTVPLLGGRLRWLNDQITILRLRSFLKSTRSEKPLLWTFDPSRLVQPARLNPILSVYHCVDDYAFGWGERSLAMNSDHVFCIAHDLMPRFRTFNRSIHFMPHGLTEKDLSPASFPSGSLDIPSGYGLYIGNINDRHDFALWEKLFKAHPDVNWLIVGPTKVNDSLGLELLGHRSLPNVHFLGEVPYDRLRSLIAGASFGFLYLRPDHPANRISSQKVVQFLAQGKPFFCSWFSEYADKMHLVHMTDSHSDALADFANWRMHGESPHAAADRAAFAGTLEFGKLLSTMPFTI